MLKRCYLLLLLMITTMSYAQLEFSNWHFGDKAGITFTEDSAAFIEQSSMFQGTSPATISDSEGNLLFYSNGRVVWDRSHNIMQNGEDLAGGYFSFASAITPKPGTPNIYYLVYMDFDFENNDLNRIFYSEIDMTLNGNLGGVTNVKNSLLTTEQLGAKLTIVQHANNEDFWLVTHGVNNANYYAYLINENGISNSPVISTNGNVHTSIPQSYGGYIGGIRISHDVKRIATVYHNDSDVYDSSVDITNFNDQTGEVFGDVLTVGQHSFEHSLTEDATGAAYYIEFSPNSRFLYVSCSNVYGYANQNLLYPSALFQYDVSATNYEDLLFSQRRIYSGRNRHQGLELGLDGKIYVVVNDFDNTEDEFGQVRSISVINSPNLEGVLSNYEHLSFPLSEDTSRPARGTLGLPQDIRGFFYLKVETEDLCSGQGVHFSLDTEDDILSVDWDFDDGTTSDELSPEHQFSPGTYYVTATVTFENSVIQRSVVVEIPDEIELPENFKVCDDASNDGVETFDLDAINSQVFRDESCGSLTFYLSESDALLGTNELGTTFTNSSNPQTIFMKVEVASNPGAFQISPIEVIIEPFPIIVSNEFTICDDESNDGFETISLSSLNSELNGNLTCAKIDYFLSESDANTNTNSISSEFENTTNPQRIYVRIESLIDESYSVSPIDVFIKEKPILDLEDVYYICPNSSLEIEVEADYDSYEWSNGSMASSITIFDVGSYSVTVTNMTSSGSCTDTFSFSVQESAAPTSFEIDINDLQPNGNSIEVIVDGIGDYEYSLDGVSYQDSPIFDNLRLPEHIVFVRDKNGCGVVVEEIKLLICQKFFTPNNDGNNDYWTIKSSFTEPDLTIAIFDRYGKLLYNFSGNDQGWDGRFNGQDMPSNDYWFVVKRPSKNKTYRGHFTLKR